MSLNDISMEDARHIIYYVFRAMHDAACPNCGYSASTFECGHGLVCPRCNFTITHRETAAIERLTTEVLKARIDALERNREKLV